MSHRFVKEFFDKFSDFLEHDVKLRRTDCSNAEPYQRSQWRKEASSRNGFLIHPTQHWTRFCTPLRRYIWESSGSTFWFGARNMLSPPEVDSKALWPHILTSLTTLSVGEAALACDDACSAYTLKAEVLNRQRARHVRSRATGSTSCRL